jgi:phage shock protein A
MGLLERIRNLIAANLNDLLERAEDPERVLTQLIADMQEDLSEARIEVAGAAREERRLYEDLADSRQQAVRMQKKAELAVARGDDDLAREALLRKQRFSRAAEAIEGQWHAQRESVEVLRQHLRDLEFKIEEARREKDLLVTRRRLARAKRGFQRTAQHVGVPSASGAFDRMAERVDDIEAEAEALSDLQMELLEGRYGRLQRESDDETIEAELRRLKEGAGGEAAPSDEGPEQG